MHWSVPPDRELPHPRLPGDHRCAMSFAVLGLAATGNIEIEEAEYIATSYPGFVDDMIQLGANMKPGNSG